MGYTTDFTGTFTLDRPLSTAQAAYLRKFAGTRRMERDPAKLKHLPDPERETVGLPVGEDGEFFTGGVGDAGQDYDASVRDYNCPPSSQPGLWCQWVPTKSGDGIQWDMGEKFYEYIAWLEYVIEKFLRPWGLVLSGEVDWVGENFDSDRGKIIVKDNLVTVWRGKVSVVYE